jgi:tRNA (guanine-N7-)-methyltransferase
MILVFALRRPIRKIYIIIMGKNKLAKFAEMETFGHVIQVPYSQLMLEEFKLKGNWNKEFFQNDNPLILELGCGKGEYTVGLARFFPGMNFIGIDIKGSRMWKGAKDIHLQGLKNAGLLRTNIELLHLFFEKNEVAEIWITFPDPQMKRVRKRLTSSRFMELYRQFLKPGGIIHLKTDSNFMFQYTSAVVRENNFEVISETEDLYDSNLSDNILKIKTFYEQQWLSRGMKIKYLKFIPHQNPLKEPEVEIEPDDYRSFGRNQRNRDRE